MFCYQCEQTLNGKGCVKAGVCGKDEATSNLQDVLFYITKGVSMYAHRLGIRDKEADAFVLDALFSTVTNVNFDTERIKTLIDKGVRIREKLKKEYGGAEELSGPALFMPAGTVNEITQEAQDLSIQKRKEKSEDITSLQEILTYGIKGMAAYAHHARILGREDESVYSFTHEVLGFLSEENQSPDKLLSYILKTGEVNLKVMELLDFANTGTYGHPVPTKVRITPVKGKAILVSGHDLKDLEELLKQTEGKGINVYTHGEMLPAHGYPGLNKYKHLAGNYGGAWQDQVKEFKDFPGSILMTTNCIQRPQDSYKDRIFTSGLVAWPGVEHISNRDFTPVIESALKAEGFNKDGEEKYITVGFGHNAVLGVAGKVIDAVKSGDIKHFFLIGGCDGAKTGRNYYTEFAEKLPKDTVILTLACGKYRFNKLDFGDIGGIPRLLDIGQCNDAYSAIKIASALAEAFGCGV
ncbi:MAG: hydroxylamine reductase, partial [Armatimonadota bacterium]